MDKKQFRKVNGQLIRRVGPIELETHVLHVTVANQKYRVVNPPQNAIGALMTANPTDEYKPTIEFVYSIDDLSREHGKSLTESNKKFGLRDFAQLFADAEKPVDRWDFTKDKRDTEPDVLRKALDALVEKDARAKWDEWSQNLCSCQKKRIIQHIQQTHEIYQAEELRLKAMMASYNTYGAILLEVLKRNHVSFMLNPTKKRQHWTLENTNDRKITTKLPSHRNEYFRKKKLVNRTNRTN